MSKSLPKKIVYLDLLDSLIDEDGGSSRAHYRLRRDFPWIFDEGWDIERWGLRPRSQTAESMRGIRLRRPPRLLFAVALTWLVHFWLALLRPRAGIVVAYSPMAGAGVATARLLRRRRPPFVVRVIENFSSKASRVHGAPRQARLIAALERFALRRADVVLPMGRFTEQLARHAKVREERILELPHPTRWFGTDAGPADPDARPVRVVGAGRLELEKAFDVLIRGFAQVAGEFPETILEIAGSGPEGGNLAELAHGLGLGERVRFPGWIPADQMPRFLGGALIAVLPSRVEEGLGMVLVEAGIAGCALVGSDLGGIRDIVRPGLTGLLVPPEDPAALAGALRSLLTNPAEARRLGASARAEALAYVGRRDDALERVRSRLELLRNGGH